MTPERWQHIDRLFQSALEHTPEERADFLKEACPGDDSVRAEVEALISAHERSGKFLDAPAYEVASVQLSNDLARAGSWTDRRPLQNFRHARRRRNG